MVVKYELPKRRPNDFSDILDYVKQIVNYVREKGDRGVIEITEKVDGIRIDKIRVDREELENYAERIPSDVKWALDLISEQLREYNQLLKPPNIGGGRNGVRYGILWRPIERVGIYIPGGRKAYPSTALMASITAVVAGVKEIFFSTPPRKDQSIDGAIAYVALKLGIKEVYRIGGPQAIASMAFGTESVKKVEKIVGPGNRYVQAAKLLVSTEVGIDGIEGPTELVIIADKFANPRDVILDLRAQSEHGFDSFLVLISDSEELIRSVSQVLMNDDKTYYLIKVNNITEAINLANEIAPEHLSLNIRNAKEMLDLIRNAGVVTINNTPPALVDYSAGPNHILPTNSWAKIRGGITVYDFLKPISYAEANEISKDLINATLILAEYEGFKIHKESVRMRYE
ncbi:MAG: histidinol dehydrogenase [Sulfolobaceae archaeon]